MIDGSLSTVFILFM